MNPWQSPLSNTRWELGKQIVWWKKCMGVSNGKIYQRCRSVKTRHKIPIQITQHCIVVWVSKLDTPRSINEVCRVLPRMHPIQLSFGTYKQILQVSTYIIQVNLQKTLFASYTLMLNWSPNLNVLPLNSCFVVVSRPLSNTCSSYYNFWFTSHLYVLNA